MGKLSMVNLVTCLFSLFWSTFWCFWSTIFTGLNFYTLPKTLIACRAMQLRFFKVKTLLNNAFKWWRSASQITINTCLLNHSFGKFSNIYTCASLLQTWHHKSYNGNSGRIYAKYKTCLSTADVIMIIIQIPSIKGSMTHLQALQISMKFLLQVASDIRRILWKF